MTLNSFNPYFIGLPILIFPLEEKISWYAEFQSLFYWITYSYTVSYGMKISKETTFQSLFYWITYSYTLREYCDAYNFPMVSILILLDYLFLLVDLGNMLKSLESFNPYFIGLPILISS